MPGTDRGAREVQKGANNLLVRGRLRPHRHRREVPHHQLLVLPPCDHDLAAVAGQRADALRVRLLALDQAPRGAVSDKQALGSGVHHQPLVALRARVRRCKRVAASSPAAMCTACARHVGTRQRGTARTASTTRTSRRRLRADAPAMLSIQFLQVGSTTVVSASARAPRRLPGATHAKTKTRTRVGRRMYSLDGLGFFGPVAIGLCTPLPRQRLIKAPRPS